MKKVVSTLTIAAVMLAAFAFVSPAEAATHRARYNHHYDYYRDANWYRDDDYSRYYNRHVNVLRDRNDFYRDANLRNSFRGGFFDFRNGQLLLCRDLGGSGSHHDVLLCVRLN